MYSSLLRNIFFLKNVSALQNFFFMWYYNLSLCGITFLFSCQFDICLQNISSLQKYSLILLQELGQAGTKSSVLKHCQYKESLAYYGLKYLLSISENIILKVLFLLMVYMRKFWKFLIMLALFGCHKVWSWGVGGTKSM